MTPRQRLLSARIAYVAIVLLATLTHLDFSADTAAASMRLARAFAPSISWSDAIDGLRNVALFAGLGSVWVLTSLTGRVRSEIRTSTIISFVLSSLVEGAQVFSPVRNASILDVFTNTLGGFVGAVASAMLVAVIHQGRGKKSYLGIPTMLIAGPYILAVICEAFTPLFDSSPIPSASGGPLARLQLSLSLSLPFDWTRIPALDIPLFGAAGFLLVALARERRSVEEHVSWAAALPLIPVIIVAHILHGATGLPIRWESVITDSVAIVLGAVAADQILGSVTQYYRGAARARVFIFSYSALLFVWGWRPLWPETHLDVITSQLTPQAFIPLGGLAERGDVFSAIHVAQQFLLYFPLGALLAVWPLQRRGPLSNIWPAVLLAIVIEIGHIGILDRTFDITNILIAAAGLAMGWISVRRSGYEPYGEATSPVRRQASRA